MIMVSGSLFKKRRGFTLLEVLIAMGSMAFGLLGMAALLAALGNVEAENRKMTKALFCAQETLETLHFNMMDREEFVDPAGQELITSGAYRGMEKKWSIETYELETGLDEIIAQCAYWWRGEKKIRSLRTLVPK